MLSTLIEASDRSRCLPCMSGTRRYECSHTCILYTQYIIYSIWCLEPMKNTLDRGQAIPFSRSCSLSLKTPTFAAPRSTAAPSKPAPSSTDPSACKHWKSQKGSEFTFLDGIHRYSLFSNTKPFHRIVISLRLLFILYVCVYLYLGREIQREREREREREK